MVTTCTRYFQSPKSRRLHMIEAHKYPKEFFFAVTNKGIGGLLRKWGEGASMIRGEWKPRDLDTKTKKLENNDDDKMMMESADDDDENSSEEVDMEELEKTPKPGVRPLHPASPPRSGDAKSNVSVDVDGLAEGMSSLALVPSSIRFGRGSRGGGLGARGRGKGGRGGTLSGAVNTNTGPSATDAKPIGAGKEGGEDRGGKKMKGYRVGGGTRMETDASSGGTGDVGSRTERGRGFGRGKRDDRGNAR